MKHVMLALSMIATVIAVGLVAEAALKSSPAGARNRGRGNDVGRHRSAEIRRIQIDLSSFSDGIYVITVDGHEYLAIRNGGAISVTHKGGCKACSEK